MRDRPSTSGIPGAFSFIEVMAALTILSASLIVLLGNQERSMALVEKARHLDAAVGLASGKMTEVVQEAQRQGIAALKKEETGEFDQEKFPGFRWRYATAEVPTPDFAAMISAGRGEEGKETEAGNAALFEGPLQAIQKVWGEGLKELRLEVLWTEGKTEKSYELVTHLISPDAVVRAQAMIGAVTGQGAPLQPAPPPAGGRRP